MAETYTLSVTMKSETVDALSTSGSFLYAFRAVQNSDRAGRPVVWMATMQYGTTTPVSWVEQYQVWTAPSTALTSVLPITPSSPTGIQTGQTAQVTSGGGITVTREGKPGAFSILNTISLQFTTGLSISNGASYSPICAFPLYGQNEQVITPLLKVALLFTTQRMAIGSVYMPAAAPRPFMATFQPAMLAAFGPALVVDMAGAPGNTRSVSYDINNGWNWGNAVWGSVVAANQSLIPELIVPDP